MRSTHTRTVRRAGLAALVLLFATRALAAQTVDHPFLGVTHITRTETSPRPLTMHIVTIDLTIPGIQFRLTPPGGTRETVRQTTLTFLQQQQAQLAVNGHFFLPFPSTDLNAMLIGLAASDGNVYSAFEAPVQSYALVTNAPALNIDPSNQASIVHRNLVFPDGTHVIEPVVLWNALAGSAQIVTNGEPTIPVYVDAANPDGLLTPGGPASYSNSNSWYNLLNARTAMGLSEDNQKLVIFTVDRAGGSQGMSLGEVANLLINDYGVYNALNLDGGGSTTLAFEHPLTHVRAIVNRSSDSPNGRAVASNLAVFADADTVAPTTTAAPQPPAGGWFNDTVTVALEAVDNPGGAVRELQYSLSGAQNQADTVAPGAHVSTTIVEEGVTTLSYFARDYVANEESPQSLVIRIDRTRPVIDGLPGEGCVFWPPNGNWRHVGTLAARDALSGIVAPLAVTIASNEPIDENDVRIDRQADGSVDVWLRATRDGSGVGRVYSLSVRASDVAANVATVSAQCSVPHDQRQ